MKRAAFLLLLSALILLPATMAYADDGTGGDRLIIGQNFTLASGESVDGSLVVVAGETTVEAGAIVRGDVIVIAGNLRLDGQALGSAVVIGGSASLGKASAVESDLVALGGSFERAEGAQIRGDIITSALGTAERLPRAAAIPGPRLPVDIVRRVGFGPVGTAMAILGQALALGVVAVLLAAFLRPQLDRIAVAAESQPLAAGSLGLLTLFMALFSIALLALTIILIPLAFAAVLMLVLAWLLGVVALGQLAGERLMVALHRSWEPMLAAGIGAFGVGLVLGTLNQIPCVGWMGSLLIGLVGLGAATITVFGTRDQLRLSAPQKAAIASPEVGPAPADNP